MATRNSNPRTPGAAAADIPTSSTASSGSASDPLDNAAALQSTTVVAAADKPDASLSEVEQLRAELAASNARQEQILQNMADLQMLVRKTVETGESAKPVKLPTVKEAQAQKHKTPVLTEDGYLVPESRDWAVSAGDRTRA